MSWKCGSLFDTAGNILQTNNLLAELGADYLRSRNNEVIERDSNRDPTVLDRDQVDGDNIHA
jgi:hypothetical protein